jgi:hypothetical protein
MSFNPATDPPKNASQRALAGQYREDQRNESADKSRQGDLASAEADAAKTAQQTLAAQTRLNAASLQLNMSMAWLQMAMGMTGKLSGR